MSVCVAVETMLLSKCQSEGVRARLRGGHDVSQIQSDRAACTIKSRAGGEGQPADSTGFSLETVVRRDLTIITRSRIKLGWE